MNSLSGLALVLLLAGEAPPAEAFSIREGEPIENGQLRQLGGTRKVPFMATGMVTLFVFFAPDQKHSTLAMQELTALRKELAEEKVHWVAVVSDRFPREEVEAELQRAEVDLPVVVDVKDELYGKLGVKLTPSVGIAGADHKLIAYLPFKKVNYQAVMRAWIQRAQGKITQEQLQAVLNPAEVAIPTGDAAAAKRQVKMGQRMLKIGELESALKAASSALEHDQGSAAAHALLGAVLAAQGKCSEALPAFEKALAIDSADATATEGRTACGSSQGTEQSDAGVPSPPAE